MYQQYINEARAAQYRAELLAQAAIEREIRKPADAADAELPARAPAPRLAPHRRLLQVLAAWLPARGRGQVEW